MQTKRFFLAGANTSLGFISNFDNISTSKNSEYRFVLKGGPGTGKSTLMKKISNYFYNKGFSIEEFYCSSDIASLDAVRIVEKNIIITDGTAPHEQDASLPKVTGEVVDLGTAVLDNIRVHRGKILKIIEKKQQCFKNAYAHLKFSAKLVKPIQNSVEIENVATRTFYFTYFNEKGMCSIEKLNKFKTYQLNKNTLFDFNNLLAEQKNIVQIKDVISLKTSQVLFPDVNMAYKLPAYKLDKESKPLLEKHIKSAGENLAKAKFYHKKIEAFYLKSINFEKLNEITSNLIQKIEKI